MKTEKCQLLIIGAGPGGYVCGIRAGQLGLNTIIVEQQKPGGTCLNIGCIPSKALIHAADEYYKRSNHNNLGITSKNTQINLELTHQWKDGIIDTLTTGVEALLKKAGVRMIYGHAQMMDGKTAVVEGVDGPIKIICENVVIATGSHPLELPDLPFGRGVISSTEALSLAEIPKKMVIVGGGYIGLEIGTALAKLGAQVTIIEAAKNILPHYDTALSKPVEKRLQELGVTIRTQARVNGLGKKGVCIVTQKGEADIPADKILVTIGRTPNLSGFGLDNLGLTMSGSFVEIDAYCATSMRGVYAIGDVTGDPMLAHRAMAQGVIVAEHIAGMPSIWDKRAIPAVCFTDPEVVVVGELPSKNTKQAVFPFLANGRAMSVERTDGFVRVVYAADSELVLGLQAVGAGVSELAGEFALALEMCATVRDIADTIHAHPTLGETVQEAAHLALGHPLHI